jgi:uncharacterized membrane protein
VAPDRAALASGLSGLVLAAVSAVPWAAIARRLAGSPGGADPSWATLIFALGSLAGFCLGVLAIWSAVKAWLRQDGLTPPARWGAALGAAAMLLVVALGPCGPTGCRG